MSPAEALVRAYYDAFNRGDHAGMLALLTDDVVHDPNQARGGTARPPSPPSSRAWRGPIASN